jgi:hypothetical protein
LVLKRTYGVNQVQKVQEWLSVLSIVYAARSLRFLVVAVVKWILPWLPKFDPCAPRRVPLTTAGEISNRARSFAQLSFMMMTMMMACLCCSDRSRVVDYAWQVPIDQSDDFHHNSHKRRIGRKATIEA